mmetsp:Transcript_83138/g.243783  ORF Transcript_83138/g.243783 Transcript_83138/m.243783 type:complete len:218 (-) Transcript_83138:1114-1767(-)
MPAAACGDGGPINVTSLPSWDTGCGGCAEGTGGAGASTSRSGMPSTCSMTTGVCGCCCCRSGLDGGMIPVPEVLSSGDIVKPLSCISGSGSDASESAWARAASCSSSALMVAFTASSSAALACRSFSCSSSRCRRISRGISWRWAMTSQRPWPAASSRARFQRKSGSSTSTFLGLKRANDFTGMIEIKSLIFSSLDFAGAKLADHSGSSGCSILGAW